MLDYEWLRLSSAVSLRRLGTLRQRGRSVDRRAIRITYLTLLDRPPTWHVRAHQSLEHPAMVGESEVKQFVDDDVVLKALIPVEQVGSQGDGPRR